MASDPNDPTTTDDEHQPTGGVDRVQEVSTNSDGTADQTDGYEIIEDPEEEAEAAAASKVKRRSRKTEPETTAER